MQAKKNACLFRKVDPDWVGALLFNKAPIKISAKYSNYNNIFSEENVVELPKNIEINKYTTKLKKDE